MVELEGLWKRYGSTTALKGISFAAGAGRVVGVLGENGSGKSTLFKILAGVPPASQGEALWDALIEAGQDAGIRPFGVEAQRLLRLEKGHIIISQDTDGLTTPHEADMAWAISRKKPYFVGMRSVSIQESAGLKRKLVGFEIADSDAAPPKECHLVIRGGTITGRVTSIIRSSTLGKVIGLAYVAPDQAEPGSEFEIKTDGGEKVRAAVVKLPFYDPDGARQEM